MHSEPASYQMILVFNLIKFVIKSKEEATSKLYCPVSCELKITKLRFASQNNYVYSEPITEETVT